MKNPIRRIFKGRSNTGGKAIMAKEVEATPPALDQAAITKLVSDTVAASLAKTLPDAIASATKPLTDALAALPKPAEAKADASKKDEPLTLDAIGKLIDSRLSATQQQQSTKAQRDKYIAEKLKDLPAAYARQLGDDPAKWAAEEQAIRGDFKTDYESKGFKLPPVGDPKSDGGTTPDKKPLDLSKMTPMQLAVQGLSESKPVTGAATVTK
jgi:hypothetical protein